VSLFGTTTLSRRHPLVFGGLAAVGPTTGSPLAIEILTGAVTSDTGFAPNVNGFVARVKFQNMIRRSPHGSKYGGYPDPVTNCTSLAITVQDAGFSAAGVPVTWQRTVHGRLPLKNPFPNLWSAIGSTVPALSWCSNAGIAYYTIAGGTKGATAPTGTTVGTAYSDGSVSWICIGAGGVGSTALATGAGDNGYIEASDGSGNMWVYMILDDPIYATSTVVSASIGAGAYSAAGVSSLAATIPTLTNNSTLAVPLPLVNHLTPDHLLDQGAARFETVAHHYWGPKNGQLANASGGAAPAGKQMIAGVTLNRYLSATPGTVVSTSVNTTSLSTLVTTSSPGGCAAEVFALSNPGAGLASAGDAYIEAVYYPWIGPAYSTAVYGEGAAWTASTNYAAGNYIGVGQIVRNGANLYYLATAGTSASSGGPTGTTTGITDGGCTWNYYGNLLTNRISQNVPARSHFYNDPSALYNTGYAFCDPSGTATGTTGVFSTYAAAAAAKGTLSNCYSSIYAAAAAIQTFNNTTNGSNTLHNDTGNGQIYLKAGTWAGVGTAMNTLTRGATWLYVQADPAATAGTVIYSEGTVKTPALRMWFGNGISFTGSTNNIGLDATIGSSVAQVGTETVISSMNLTLLSAGVNDFANRTGTTWYLNNTFTTRANCNSQLATASTCAGFHGNNCTSLTVGTIFAPFAMGNRIACGAILIDPRQNTGAPLLYSQIIASNKILGRTDTAIAVLCNFAITAIALVGQSITGNLIVTRQTTEKCGQISADSSTNATSNTVVAYNSCVGDRLNYAYDDVNGPTTAIHTNWCHAHNITTQENIVRDTMYHISVPNGLCCQNYFAVYKVGFQGNVNLLGSTTQNPAVFSFYDLIGPVDPAVFPAIGKYNQYASGTAMSAEFHTDNSATSAAPSMAADGDYRPVAGTAKSQGAAAWLGLRYDLLGVTRVNTAGALEAA